MNLNNGRYTILKKLGKGAFGEVYLVYDNQTSIQYAAKKFSTEKLSGDSIDAITELDNLKQIRNFNHIIELAESFVEKGTRFIVTEFCEDGDLSKLINFCREEERFLSEDQVLEFSRQILKGLSYLHEEKIIHRDVKPGNIFLKNNKIKLGDLGLAIHWDETERCSPSGTPCYMAPEVVSKTGFSFPSDIWSTACVIYELGSLKKAFYGKSVAQVLHSVLNDDVPEYGNSFIISCLLDSMFQRKPEKRPTSHQLFNSLNNMLHKKKLAEQKIVRDEIPDISLGSFKTGRYKIIKKLGKKLFGTMYLVEDTVDNTRKSLKIIDNCVTQEDLDYSLNEIDILRRLKSPYIIEYYEDFRELFSTCIVTQYCPNGDLGQLISRYQKLNQIIPFPKILKISIELMRALHYLHSNNIIHRNIKPGNVLLDLNKAKLGDLGVAKSLESISKAYTQSGSPHYLSPEIIKNEGYNAKTDVWSAACVIFELNVLEKAFPGKNFYEIATAITKSNPKGIKRNNKLRKILEKMFVKDHVQRETSKYILIEMEKLDEE